jgi:KamA family protein
MNEKYKAYNLRGIFTNEKVSQSLCADQKFVTEVIGRVLPFKVDNYVIDELIDWSNIPDDPIFQLTFPQMGMLSDLQFNLVADALKRGESEERMALLVNAIRKELNPNPGGQMEHNVPEINGRKLRGLQHKYKETVLFFPSRGQTCHAYCSFCFRWPQFVGMDELKFAMNETELVIDYLREHSYVTDVLFTGGDPLIMPAAVLRNYIQPIMDSNLEHIKNIRIGTKALGYWPYRFTTDKDADDLIRLFDEIIERGFHLSIMAHFTHPVELKTDAVKKAISRIRSTGSQIRTQSPIMRYINDSSEIWTEMWKEQVRLGCIPYYMFIARDTGAHSYFALPLERALRVYQESCSQLSGLSKTVRGPVMATDPGKIEISGVTEILGEKIFVLKFIQSREPEWLNKTFFAHFNDQAVWLNDLTPAFDSAEFFSGETPMEESIV